MFAPTADIVEHGNIRYKCENIFSFFWVPYFIKLNEFS